MKIHRTLFDRKNLPILAVLLALLSFFSIRFETVKQVILDLMPRPSAGEPFFCALKDEKDVDAKGGDVHIYSSEKLFLPGGCSSGFVSKEKEDQVTFPVPDWFADPKAGTIELCLTPQTKFFEQKFKDGDNKNLFLFSTVPDANAIEIKISYPRSKGDLNYPSILRLRIKSRDGDNPEKNSRAQNPTDEPIKWKAGHHYHIAGTWGEKGIRLYIDGELVGDAKLAKELGESESRLYQGPPKELVGRFVVNNTSPNSEECEHPTHCIISNLVIHGAPLEPEDLGEECPIRDHWHPEK